MILTINCLNLNRKTILSFVCGNLFLHRRCLSSYKTQNFLMLSSWFLISSSLLLDMYQHINFCNYLTIFKCFQVANLSYFLLYSWPWWYAALQTAIRYSLVCCLKTTFSSVICRFLLCLASENNKIALRWIVIHYHKSKKIILLVGKALLFIMCVVGPNMSLMTQTFWESIFSLK